MQTMRQFAAMSKSLGHIKGQSAKEFHARDPKAAEALAAWLSPRIDALSREVAQVVQKRQK